jgi:hypothetical protein
MKSRDYVAFLGLVSSLLLALTAKANLIESTAPGFGADSLLIDTSTQIGWLNLSETAGLSYDQALADTQPGGLFSGYTFATAQQILGLYDDAGVKPGDYVLSNSSVQSFISLIGNIGPINTYPGFIANSATSAGAGAQVAPSIYATEINGSEGYLVSVTTGSSNYGDTTSEPDLANWLIITVPEPNVFAIAITGLIGLALIRRFLGAKRPAHPIRIK